MIVLPQAVYYNVFNEMASSGDGGQVYAQHVVDDVVVSGTVSYGKIRSSNMENIYRAYTRLPMLGNFEFDNNHISPSVRIDVSTNWSFIYSFTPLHYTYQPNTQFDFLPSHKLYVDVHQFGARYVSDSNVWSVTGEYFLTNSHRESPLLDPSAGGSVSYYVLADYEIVPGVIGFIGYNKFGTDADPDGKKTEAASYGMIKAHQMFADDITVGFNYILDNHWSAKLEYHKINGTAWLPYSENKDISSQRQKWELFGASVTYQF
jgi:hypothetical protein